MHGWFFNDPRVGLLRKLYLAVEMRLSGREIGDYLSIVAGSGSTFDGHREYLPGDDFRLIDRVASNRLPGNQMVIRQIRQDTSLPVMIVVDGSPRMEFGPGGVRKSDITLAAAGSFAFMMSNRRNPVGQMLARGGDGLLYTEPQHGDMHLLRQLGNLVQHEGEEGKRDNLGLALEKVNLVFRQPGVIIVAGDLLGKDNWMEQLGVLAFAGHQIVGVQTRHPMDKEFPEKLDGKSLVLKNPAVCGKQKMQTITSTGREKYRRRMEGRQEKIEAFFERPGCELLTLMTDEDWLMALYEYMVSQPQRQKGARYARHTSGNVA